MKKLKKTLIFNNLVNKYPQFFSVISSDIKFDEVILLGNLLDDSEDCLKMFESLVKLQQLNIPVKIIHGYNDLLILNGKVGSTLPEGLRAWLANNGDTIYCDDKSKLIILNGTLEQPLKGIFDFKNSEWVLDETVFKYIVHGNYKYQKISKFDTHHVACLGLSEDRYLLMKTKIDNGIIFEKRKIK